MMDQGIDEEPQIDVWSPTRATSKVEVKNVSSNDGKIEEESKPDSDASALGPAASSESESSQGEASPPHTLLERVSDLSISDFKKVAALVLQMDSIKANTALDFRCLGTSSAHGGGPGVEFAGDTALLKKNCAWRL